MNEPTSANPILMTVKTALMIISLGNTEGDECSPPTWRKNEHEIPLKRGTASTRLFATEVRESTLWRLKRSDRMPITPALTAAADQRVSHGRPSNLGSKIRIDRWCNPDGHFGCASAWWRWA